MNLFGNFYRNKKVLITGDTGFKGSWLAIWLRELGAEVIGYSLPPKTERDNFVKCSLSGKINHNDGDIRDFSDLLAVFEKSQPDIAFHLAAQPIVLDSYSNPRYTFETNIMGTVNFFEAVRQVKSVKAAVNITSDKCYQNSEWVWGYRENDPMGGEDPYSASKGASEIVTHSYRKSFFYNSNSASIASARAGNVIGGGDWAEFRIVPDFFRALEKNESLTLRYPDATRPWQHVLEPLSGYLLLAYKLYNQGHEFAGGWNFGPNDRNNHSVEKLIKSFIDVSKIGEYTVDASSEKKHEASMLKLDISKAVNFLGWLPVFNFHETVSFTVNGYLAEMDKTASVYDERVKQINDYIELGYRKRVPYFIAGSN